MLFFSLHPSGMLLATCCSDGSVQVYTPRQPMMEPSSQFCCSRTFPVFAFPDGAAATLDEGKVNEEGPWELVCKLLDHIGPVYKCCWCPASLNSLPVLATVGADRAIFVYHFQQLSSPAHHTPEVVKAIPSNAFPSPPTNTSTGGGGSSFLQATRWHGWKGVEKDTITDIAFLPPGRESWMVLSTASLDGCVRLYEVKQKAGHEHLLTWEPDTILTNRRAPRIESTSPGPASPISSFTGVKGAVTALSWFSGRVECSRTIAVGCMSGKIALARWNRGLNFEEISFSPAHSCSSPVVCVSWAPPVGRRFILLAACSRHEVLIFRLHVCSPEFLRSSLIDGTTESAGDQHLWSGQAPRSSFAGSSISSSSLLEVFRCTSCGACGLSWNKSATILGLVSDRPTTAAALDREVDCDNISRNDFDKHFLMAPNTTTTRFLQMGDPRNHQSWKLL